MRVNAKGILRDGDGYENGKKFFSKRRKKYRTWGHFDRPLIYGIIPQITTLVFHYSSNLICTF